MTEDKPKTSRDKEEKAPSETAAERSSLAWIYESVIVFAGLWAVQHYLFPEDPGFRNTSPNPYWLGVLLFSLRYGTLPGIVSGIYAGFLFAFGFVEAGERFVLEDPDFYFRPGLFALVGIALGLVADRFAHRASWFKNRIQDLLASEKKLERALQEEQKVRRSIEEKVVSQMSSMATLFHGARELGALDREELLPAIHRFFTIATKSEKSAMYVFSGGDWPLLQELGWEEGDAFPRKIEPGIGVLGKAVAEGQVRSLRDFFPTEEDVDWEKEATGDAIMAAPILGPSGAPIAVFAVQRIDYLEFNTASVNLLALLAEWGAESVAKCEEVERLKERSVFDEDLLIYSTHYFELKLAEEFARSRRTGSNFAVLVIDPAPDPAMTETQREAAQRVAGRVLRETVRKTDVAARLPKNPERFVILANGATPKTVPIVRNRFLKAFEKLDLERPVQLGIASFGAKMKSEEEVVAKAVADLRA